MGMDQDFPISGTQAKVLIVGLVVMGAFGAALFGGAIPGLKPNYTEPSTAVLDGEQYYYTNVFLSMPLFPINHTSPQFTTFHNVTFAIWLTNWYSVTGGLVRGNGTERNGTAYSFILGESETPPVNTTLFISPDRVFAAYWHGGFLGGFSVQLLVKV
jgi:hypothetical protein